MWETQKLTQIKTLSKNFNELKDRSIQMMSEFLTIIR